MSKFNFNIDIEDNKIQDSLSKSKYNSISQKELYDLEQYTIDLGLPSGTLWCKYNLGVDINRLNRYIRWYGDYYAWGELEPKNEYTWDNYKFGNQFSLKKYLNNKESEKNMKTHLDLEDDAAYQNLHIGNLKFMIPSKEQFEELIEFTNVKWINNYKGIKYLDGQLYKGKNDNELFIPAAGLKKQQNNIEFDGNEGYIWTCDLYNSISGFEQFFEKNDFSQFAYNAYFNKGVSNYTNIIFSNRYYGLPIRPVINLK